MKYMKRAGIYKASNVTFNPMTLNAYSYEWWRFVAKVEGKLVFDNYGYSNSTRKHQYRVRRLLEILGIKIDIAMPIPKGIGSNSLAELILEAEEYLCDTFLINQLKAQERYQTVKHRKQVAKLTEYLENQVHFRNYDIANQKDFGNPSAAIANKIAVHQCVDMTSIEADVANALYNFSRDGFGSVVFYV